MATLVAPILENTSVEELKNPDLAVPTHDPSTYKPVDASHSSADDANTIDTPRGSGLSINTTPCGGPMVDQTSSSNRTRDDDAVLEAYRSPIRRLDSPSSFRNARDNVKRQEPGLSERTVGTWSWKLFSGSSLARFRVPRVFSIRDNLQQQLRSELPTTNSLASSSSLSPSISESTSSYTALSSFPTCSITSSRTSADFSSITIPTDSPSIYCWSTDLRIYIGKLKDIQPPPSMENDWINSIRVQLLGDLRVVIQSLPRSLSRDETIVEPELCMAGTADNDFSTVELKPTVWIRCGSKRCQKAVAQAVEDLIYLHTFAKGRIQVHRRAPSFATGIPENVSTDFQLLPAVQETPTVHLLSPSTNSAIGTKVRFTLGWNGLVRERMSTIGGLIRVDGQVYGLTTAHAAAELHYASLEEDLSTDYESDEEFTSDSGLGVEAPLFASAMTDFSGISTTNNTTVNWLEARLGPCSYAGKTNLTEMSNAFTVSEGSDFALIELCEEHHQLVNTYEQRMPAESRTSHPVGIRKLASNLQSGPVSILCSPTDVRAAHLLDEDCLFLDRTTVFHTKKIQTDGPLERGLSGAWIVRDTQLLGILLAVYEDESYAHILPITQVLSDIRALLSNGNGIPKVDLPGQNAFHQVEYSYEDARSLHEIRFPSLEKQHPCETESDDLLNDEKVALSRGIISPDLPPDIVEFQNQVLLLAAYSSIFIISFDMAILPTILPGVSDSFHSMHDIGLYGAINFICADLERMVLRRFYPKVSVQWMLCLALWTFQIGCLLCFLAVDSATFVVGRALCGIGTTAITNGVVLLVQMVTEEQRELKISTCQLDYPDMNLTLYFMFDVVECIASVIGPLIAGAASNHIRGAWRICFILLFSISPCVTIMLSSSLQSIPLRHPQPNKYDGTKRSKCVEIISSLFFSIAAVVLLLALRFGPLKGWNSALSIGGLITSGFLFTSSLATQSWARHKMDTRGAIIAAARLLWEIALIVPVFYLPVMFQAVKGADSMESGTLYLSAVGTLAVCSTLVRIFVLSQYKFRIVIPFIPILSFLLVGLAVGLSTTLSPISKTSTWYAYQLIFGFGAGICPSQTWDLIMADQSSTPTSRSLVDFGKSLGRVLGIGIAQTIFMSLLNHGKPSVVPDFRLVFDWSHDTDLSNEGVDTARYDLQIEYKNALMPAFYLSVAPALLIALAVVLISTFWLLRWPSRWMRRHWKRRYGEESLRSCDRTTIGVRPALHALV